jgi:cytochrome c553
MRNLTFLLVAVLGFAADPRIEFFETKVRPILVNNCYACHSADTKPAGGLRVDDRNGLLRGGESGPAVVPGDPQKSMLIDRVRHANPRRRMPKEGAVLTADQIADLSTWIAAGAAWPAEQISVATSRPAAAYERLRARHWSLQPVANPNPPSVTKNAWPTSDLDRFVLAKLEEKNLAPVAAASPRTLIRRLTYDLIGLPPTPAEIDAFLADKSPKAYERLVDRLLSSPRFGERWGRHWLDVARYGESSGPSRNIPYPHAWRYRDYVIDSVNRDVPFNRFLQEQIAGDQVPAVNNAERDRLQIATGFLALGPKDVNQRFKERFVMDNVAEQIDTVTRSTLALTVGCARCHDHKFDPIPTADYYALAGIFTSTDDAAGVRSKMGGAGLDYYDPKMLIRLASFVPRAPTGKLAQLEAEVAVAKKVWDDIRGTPEGLALAANGKPAQQPFRLKYERLQGELLSLTDPASYGFAVHGARDAAQVGDTAIRLRGEAERLGPEVPRGFLTAFQVPGAPKIDRQHSGRLELAQWLSSDLNPLTPRVIVNRIWQHLFGHGIVSTVDNFGITGDRPSHPQLLDHLTSKFIADGWSTKRLVRTIVLSRTYRLGTDAPATHRDVDPGNRLLWRHSPRRLDAEEVRDTLLATAGRLQLQPPAASPAAELKMIEMPDNGVESRAINEKADASLVRSIYLPLLRGVTPKSLEAFDPVTQTLVTGQRDATTVPTQALFLLNSSFVRRQSLTLGETLLKERSPLARIRQAYRLTLGREPSAGEIARAQRFVDEYETAFAQAPPPAPVKLAPAVVAKPIVPTAPIDPDNIDRTDYVAVEERVEPKHASAGAWMSLVQALYGSAEFRFVR